MVIFDSYASSLEGKRGRVCFSWYTRPMEKTCFLGPNGDWTSKHGIKSGFDSQRLGIESTTLGYNQHLPSGKLT